MTDHLAVRAIADEVGATPAQVGLAWLLAHYDRTLLIPGTADPAHLNAQEEHRGRGRSAAVRRTSFAALDALTASA